jgi:hypothetical protein
MLFPFDLTLGSFWEATGGKPDHPDEKNGEGESLEIAKGFAFR